MSWPSSARTCSVDAVAAPVRLGSTEPRIWTKPLRPLEPRCAECEAATLGYFVIDFAAAVIKLPLLEWQKWALVHALELREDGTLRFRTVLILVARQNGKSLLSQVVALWFMYVYGFALVIGTAQDLDVTREIWRGAVELAQEAPQLRSQIARVVLGNGSESLELATNARRPDKVTSRYKVKAATRRAGRGLSGDLVLLDELREHQSWDAWGAVTKTMMARAEAQVWALSNAGDAASIVLGYLRKVGHAALGDPDGLNKDDDVAEVVPDDALIDDEDDTFAIFEWSARPGCPVHDRDGWAQANPAMGVMITERTILSAMRLDPEWVFRTEVLCQWNAAGVEGPFPVGAWEKGVDDEATIVGSAIAFGIDVSFDRTFTSIVACGRDKDGRPHLRAVADRAGTEWVVPWLVEQSATREVLAVALQGKGAPVSALAEDIREAGLPLLLWQGSDLTGGTGKFYDAVCQSTFTHATSPLLDGSAAASTTKPLGDSWVWNRRHSPSSPLIAANAAWWALTCRPKPTRSAYEDADLVVA